MGILQSDVHECHLDAGKYVPSVKIVADVYFPTIEVTKFITTMKICDPYGATVTTAFVSPTGSKLLYFNGRHDGEYSYVTRRLTVIFINSQT